MDAQEALLQARASYTEAEAALLHLRDILRPGSPLSATQGERADVIGAYYYASRVQRRADALMATAYYLRALEGPSR